MSDSAAVAAAERDSNQIVENTLNDRAEALAEAATADVLAYIGPMYSPGDDEVKDALDEKAAKRKTLLVLLETRGGYIHVAERMAKIFRHHYRRVEFVVPTFAMSAGTVLAMSGDAIWMDYASVLGPIDPQVMHKNGSGFVPALGYLEQYRRFVEKSNRNALSTAELAYFIQNFDLAELYAYEQEQELSTVLLVEWLVQYKFKNWKTTDGAGRKVTEQMREERARDIARKLGDASLWHSHSRGICMEVLRQDLKLLIDDFRANNQLTIALHDYFRLLQDYQARRGHERFVIHTEGRHVGY